MIPIDLSECSASLQKALLDEFQKGREFERVRARLEQEETAKDHREFRSIEGLGRTRMRVSSTAFHYWGQRLGYECWWDKQFLHEFERDNPEVRVRCGGTRLMVGWVPPSYPKFRKSYAHG